MSMYEPLKAFLEGRSEPVIRMTFAEIEGILGRPLPASARKYSAWWANEQSGSHSHARSWMEAHRMTRRLDLNSASVEFVR